MNQFDDEDRLRGLLDDAVADVEPAHRLEAIRRRAQTQTPYRTQVTAMPTPRSRSWIVAALGAAVATAAVVGVAVVVTQGGEDPPPVSSSPGTNEPATDQPTTNPPTSEPTPTSEPQPGEKAMAVYYVGDGPRGPRLFREFHRVDPARAVTEATEPPLDPDYRTDWQPGDIVSSARAGSLIRVTLGDPALADRPAGMTAQEAAAAIQSLVYTAQAAYQSRDRVQFVVGDQPLPALYGVPLEAPVRAASIYDVLSLMSITAPSEGQRVSGSFEASGANNGFEATMAWQLRDGDVVVKQGSAMATGWMGEKLFPWKTTISLDGVPAGTYTFVATNDDPSGGEEGNGPDVDTRTVIVE